MIHEYQPTVPKIYLILPSLKPVLNNATDVGLIAMVYRIIKNRNRWVCGDFTGYLWWQRTHSFVVDILILLAIADTALYIYAQVLLFGHQVDQLIDPRLAKAANSYKEVHLTYNALYLVTTVEIMGCAIFILWRARAQKLKSRVSYSSTVRPKQRSRSLMLTTFLQIMTYLLLLVEPFLILRSTALLVVAVLYVFEARTEAYKTTVIEVALWGVPSIFIFTGLVLIQYRKDWESYFRYTYDEVPVHGPAMQAADGTAPWPQNQNNAWKKPVVQWHYNP